MKRLKPWIVLALVFAAGVMVGIGGTRFAVRRVVERTMNNPALAQDRLERELARELRLTPDQRSSLHAILERSQGDLRQIREEFRPRIGVALRRSEREIRALLNERQQQRFERILKNRPLVPPSLNPAGAAAPKEGP